MDIKNIIKTCKKDESLKSELNIENIVHENEINGDLNTIIEDKIRLFDSVQILQSKKNSYLDKLTAYIYIDDLSKLEKGKYIRWINEKGILSNGSFLLDILFNDSGVNLMCKNAFNKMFQIKYDKNYIFQLMSENEQMIYAVHNYVNSI